MRPTSEMIAIINKAVERGFDVNDNDYIYVNLANAQDYLVEDAIEFETFKITKCKVINNEMHFNGQSYPISDNCWEVDGKGIVHKLEPQINSLVTHELTQEEVDAYFGDDDAQALRETLRKIANMEYTNTELRTDILRYNDLMI